MSHRINQYALLLILCAPGIAAGQQVPEEDELTPFLKPEQCVIRSRPAEQLRPLPGPLPTPPPTVSVPHPDATELRITLDDAIRMALQNAEVIRVLVGNGAVSQGQTIYDPAIAHTDIDRQISAYDPVFSANNTFNRSSRAIADPVLERFNGSTSNGYSTDVGVTQRNLAGGQASFGVRNDWSRTGPRGVLNPQNQPSIELSYTQSLLAGAGVRANRVPILLARIDTERSFFRFKDSIQELTRSVIEGYWNLVFARTDLWARERQVEQAQTAFDRARVQQEVGLADIGAVSQRRVALANFRANLISARANLLDREAALKNVIGVPPNDGIRLIPVTSPTRELIEFDWQQLVNTANTYRPDLIELKLVLDADEQRLLQSRNFAQPNLDAVALYRWNGVSGQLPTGRTIRSGVHESGDWTLGVNFSVPVRLRASRASLRSAELLLSRDRANLKQGQHAATHEIATSLRGLAATFSQYEAFVETREAAFVFLQQQGARRNFGLADFLVVLQAINDWGNAVSSEARTLTQYNAQLALLERQTGTILDTHGIRFCEEKFCSLGPLGRHGSGSMYPRSLDPQENTARYPDSGKPAEAFFDLDRYPRAPGRRGDAYEPPSVPRNPRPEALPQPDTPQPEIPRAPKDGDGAKLEQRIEPIDQ